MPRESLTALERLGRAAQFYSKAIPVFVSYLLLDRKHKMMGIKENSAEAEKEWNDLHDWGSDEISKVNMYFAYTLLTTSSVFTPDEFHPITTTCIFESRPLQN